MARPAPGARASLLLRLDTDSDLTSAELHHRGALLLAGNQRGEVLVFATGDGALVQRLAELSSRSPSSATSVAWAEVDGVERVIAGHRSGNVRVWDVASRAVLCKLPAHRSDVTALACMAPLGLLATGSANCNIKLWSLGGCTGAAPTPAAGRTASSREVEPVQVLKGHAAPITQLRFTPDGELLFSGDAKGGLRVWQVEGGAAGRLLHNLDGTHSGAVTSIACHPEERLFVTGSADRTLRVWDMDARAGSCIGTHGPEGRRPVHALAFTSTGAALLAAYPDGLRTFTLDPLTHCDHADVGWPKVHSIRYTDGKVISISLAKGDAVLHCVDLTRMRPFAGGSGATSLAQAQPQPPGGSGKATAPELDGEQAGAGLSPAARMRFSDKYRVAAAGAAGPAALGRAGSGGDEPSTIAAAWPSAHLMPALAATSTLVLPAAGTQQKRQADLWAATSAATGAGGPAIEVYAPAALPARHTQRHASFTAAAPSGRLPHSAAPVLSATGGPAVVACGESPAPGPVHAPSQGSGGKGGRPRLSAEENGSHQPGNAPGGNSQPKTLPASGKPPEAGGPEVKEGCQPVASMLDVATHRGFQSAALQAGRQLCARLRASRELWQEVRFALRRGDLREAARLLRDAQDLSVAAKVVESRALWCCHPDRFTPELCSEALLPLAAQLLGSSAVLHRQAALALVAAVLARWGAYARDALSNVARHGKVDLELERRQERSRTLLRALQQLQPALDKLAIPLGGGQARQLLDRIAALSQ